MRTDVPCVAVAIAAPAAVFPDTDLNEARPRRALPAGCCGIAAGTQLTDDEFWSVCCWLDRDYSYALQLSGPLAYAGRVWEAAVHLAQRAGGEPVTPQRVWASAQGRIRTWDVREMTNAISVPRPRKKRKTKAEDAKKLAVRVIHFADADTGAEDYAGLTEEMLPSLSAWSRPDELWTEMDKYHYSDADAVDLLLQELCAGEHTHPGATLLREVLETVRAGRVTVPKAAAATAKQHRMGAREVWAAITEFLTSEGGDSSDVLQALRSRGKGKARKPRCKPRVT